MRKWLIFVVVLTVVYILMRLNTRQGRRELSRFKRINFAVTLFVWILCAIYLTEIAYWLYDKVLR